MRDIVLDSESEIEEIFDEAYGLPVLKTKAYRSKAYYKKNDEKEEITATFIPYYAFANSGESEMLVWLQIK